MITKISYICECCDEAFNELEIGDLYEAVEDLEGLTEEERHDIIKMHENGGRVFVTALCDDCIAGLGLDDGNDFLFAQTPVKH